MTKAEMYMNVMICVLMADGIVDEQERELFFQMVESVGLDPQLIERYRQFVQDDETIDIDSMIGAAVNDIDPGTLAWIIQDAYAMADVDGRISPEEVDMINQILRRADIPSERFDDIRDWAVDCIEVEKRGLSLFAED